MRDDRVVALACVLLPTLAVILPLLHAGGGGAMTPLVLTPLLIAATTALLDLGRFMVPPRPAPTRAVVRRARSQLPTPLPVTVPAVPSRPRAPGRV